MDTLKNSEPCAELKKTLVEGMLFSCIFYSVLNFEALFTAS